MPTKIVQTNTFWFDDDPDGVKLAKFKKKLDWMLRNFWEELYDCSPDGFQHEVTEVEVQVQAEANAIVAKPMFCLRYRDCYLSRDYGPTTNPSEILFFNTFDLADLCHFDLSDSAHYFTQVCKNFGADVNFNEFKVVQYAGFGSDQKVPA